MFFGRRFAYGIIASLVVMGMWQLMKPNNDDPKAVLKRYLGYWKDNKPKGMYWLIGNESVVAWKESNVPSVIAYAREFDVSRQKISDFKISESKSKGDEQTFKVDIKAANAPDDAPWTSWTFSMEELGDRWMVKSWSDTKGVWLP